MLIYQIHQLRVIFRQAWKGDDINQCSFGFYVTEETWDYSVEPALRTIKEVDLYEISVVSIPAYDDTEVSLVRSKELAQKLKFEKHYSKKLKPIGGKIMNKQLLIALQKRNKQRLTDLRARIEDPETREDELAEIKDEIDTITEELQSVADSLSELDDEDEKMVTELLMMNLKMVTELQMMKIVLQQWQQLEML